MADWPLILFDVDGTLIHTRGAGMRSFKLACEEIFQKPLKLTKHNFAGKLDILIFKTLFDVHASPGLEWEPAWTEFKKLYLVHLAAGW